VAAGDTVSDAQLEALMDPLDRLVRATLGRSAPPQVVRH
jgi:hypothetical protein